MSTSGRPRRRTVSAGLDSRLRQRLDVEGWLSVQLFDAGEVARFRAVCEALVEADRAAGESHGGTVHIGELEARAPALAPLWEHPLILEAIAAVVDPSRSDGTHLRSPLPGHGAQSLHADAAGHAAPGSWTVCTVIAALCDFTADNGPTRVVPRTHREQDRAFQAHSPSVRHPRERLLTGPAGTVFVINGHLLHSGTRNNSEHPRPAVLTSHRAV